MKLLPSLALALLMLPTLSAFPAVAQDNKAPPPKPSRPGVETPAKAGEPAKVDEPLTTDLAGPYLAARAAAMENDYSAAANYYLRALSHDPQSAYLADSAMVALISSGQIDRAIQQASSMPDANAPTDLAGLVKRADLARKQDWDGLIKMIDASTPATDKARGNQLLDSLLRAWAHLGAGRASEATAEFERLAKIPAAGPLVKYHHALTKALVGDYEGAAKLIPPDQPQGHLMGLIAQAEILAQLDRRDEAIKMLESLDVMDSEPDLKALVETLRTGGALPFDVVRDARDGIAQVFLSFAAILNADDGDDPNPLGLIHARLGAYVAPDMVDARLMVAQMLQSLGQFDAAEAEFDSLRAEGKMRPLAELARIDALSRNDRRADAEKAAVALTAEQPDFAQGWIALGDLLRQQDKFAQAIPAYDKAIALINPMEKDALWFPLYARAIAYERSGQFDKAEVDLKAALAIRPEDANVLNYLGYSYVDRGKNLDEAQKLIERAVALSPDDGYILDSLAWVYYRIGRYAEAVAPMERAVELMSDDSLVNDHLGDIYWKVGRKREAEIQWQRALNFGPEKPEDVERIRAKLDRGLDAVLEQEKANGGKLPPAPAPAPVTAPVQATVSPAEPATRDEVVPPAE